MRVHTSLHAIEEEESNDLRDYNEGHWRIRETPCTFPMNTKEPRKMVSDRSIHRLKSTSSGIHARGPKFRAA